ncbi:caspase-8 isoform 2-T4 [Anableps anableps]
MNRLLLAQIDENLDSTEVAELCFLCSDVINRKRLEGIKDAKELFMRLEEKALLENPSFLSELLRTIHRADLLNLLESDSRQREETDATPILSDYRLMLYKIHENLSTENLDKMKFLLKDQIAKRHLEMSSTTLNVFAEMEKAGLISDRNVDKLHTLLSDMDLKLAETVIDYKKRLRPPPAAFPNEQVQRPDATNDQQRQNGNRTALQPSLSMCPAEPIHADNPPQATPSSSSSFDDKEEFYSLTQNPLGICVIINNELFKGPKLSCRTGTTKDEESLSRLFKRFGFILKKFHNLTAEHIIATLKMLGDRDYSKEDALVVCVLSHGAKGTIYGIDEKEVKLDHLIDPFRNSSSLLGKPKLFFIQACQIEESQTTQNTKQDEFQETMVSELCIETSAPSKSGDILLGMATVPNAVSYRHTKSGSLYIQELCKQLEKAAESPEKDDILTVLTRVNREVSNNYFVPNKQMPEPKYTLTKRLVFRFR